MKNSLYVGMRFGNNKKVSKSLMELIEKKKAFISEVYLECWDEDGDEITISLKNGYYFESIDPYDKISLIHETDLNVIKWHLSKDIKGEIN